MLARGATPWIRAYKAVELRNELKVAFRFGLSEDRVYGLGEMVAKYGPNPQAIVDAASRTNAFLNLLGGAYAAQGP